MFCKSCNADDPPHAPGCWAADLHDMHEKGKLNGLLQAQAIALQCAIDAPTPEARESAEVVAGMIAGAALGMSMNLPTARVPESRLVQAEAAQGNCSAQEATEKMGWTPTELAPRDVPLIVKTERGRIFRAKIAWLDDDAGWTWMTVEDGDPCPACWTDDVCWTVNADGERSDWPVAFMPVPNGSKQDREA